MLPLLTSTDLKLLGGKFKAVHNKALNIDLCVTIKCVDPAALIISI